jgi:pyruvate/2-oxoglutarate dehydrogenase complex dihydrolipoamide dehydrogenase (E3) component
MRYDMVVIGAGPAGEKAATQAAYFGRRVAVVDRREAPGGSVVGSAGIPTKTLRETALYLTGSGGASCTASARDHRPVHPHHLQRAHQDRGVQVHGLQRLAR